MTTPPSGRPGMAPQRPDLIIGGLAALVLADKAEFDADTTGST